MCLESHISKSDPRAVSLTFAIFEHSFLSNVSLLTWSIALVRLMVSSRLQPTVVLGHMVSVRCRIACSLLAKRLAQSGGCCLAPKPPIGFRQSPRNKNQTIPSGFPIGPRFMECSALPILASCRANLSLYIYICTYLSIESEHHCDKTRHNHTHQIIIGNLACVPQHTLRAFESL